MVSTELIITQVLNGLTIGLIFALIALGLTIILGLMGVVNFAHGSFYTLGGYITYTITSSVLGNFWIGLIGGAVVCAAVGVGLFVSIVRPLRERPPLEPMVALLFRKTDLGARCLASIQDRETAMSLGVDVDRVGRLMFIIGMAVAGVAGGLAGPIFSVYPTMGIELIGLIFVIVIVGGLGSIGGTVIAGITIAMITSISLNFVSGNVAHIFAYCILLVILVIRPRGIMGFEKVLE